MESARVRGCVTNRAERRTERCGATSDPWLADASRRRNGPRKSSGTVLVTSAEPAGRSRCGLEVSPASSPTPDVSDAGRRPVVAEKVGRSPQGGGGGEGKGGRRAPIHP